MKLLDKAKAFLNIPGTEEMAETGESIDLPEKPTTKLQMTARVPDYANTNAPMNVEEMKVCMVPELWRMEEQTTGETPAKVKGLHRLFLGMEDFLEQSRRISREPADAYKRLPPRVPLYIRVGKIQEQMRAIRFRLEIKDYRNKVEMQILKDRLFQLYGEAKVIDPDGTARYERMIDKQMRRAR